MITLDQIKQLDSKVRKAVDRINSLNSENNMLQEKLDNYQLRIEELEILIDTFKEDQGEIEEGIIDALNHLDILEDNIISKVDNTTSEQEANEDKRESEDEVIIENDADSEINNDSSDLEIADEKKSDPKDESGNSEIELDIF